MHKTNSKENCYSINSVTYNQDKYDSKIIEKYLEHRDRSLDKHSRIIQKRFDLRAPIDFKLTSKEIYRFNDYALRNLRRNNPLPENGMKRSSGKNSINPQHRMDPSIMLVREQNHKDRNFHVHGIVFFNGQARQNGHYVQKKLEQVWNGIVGVSKKDSGLVNNSIQNGPDHIILDKNKPDFEEQKQQAFKQALYLAKTRGKELNPKGSWRTTGSRLRKK